MILINDSLNKTCPTLNGEPVTLLANNLKDAVDYLKSEYDLDCLEIGVDSVYMHFGRVLKIAEFNQLNAHINSLQVRLK